MHLQVLLSLLLNIYVISGRPSSWNWYEDMEQDDEASNSLSLSSVFYNTFRIMQDRMNFYGPATHVGKIYRGAYQKPELLQPRYWTFGWGADFIKQDSNAFR